LDDVREVTIKPGTQHGETIRLRNEGIEKVRGRGRGDLVVDVAVDIPTDLDDEQRELLEEYAELYDISVEEPGFFDRIKESIG
ncbi:MAG: DnaJ C-terminal domain-containing protein, partial [Bradymonadaceae bacterium]